MQRVLNVFAYVPIAEERIAKSVLKNIRFSRNTLKQHAQNAKNSSISKRLQTIVAIVKKVRRRWLFLFANNVIRNNQTLTKIDRSQFNKNKNDRPKQS